MKQSKEILMKPIISIQDGKEIGKVKNLVINPEQRSIEFLVVQNDQWQFGIKAIPFKLVIGMGDYAVTVESENAVIDLADIPIANELLTKHIQIKGTQIISKQGHFLGKIAEYYFSQETGKILGCILEGDQADSMIVPQESVVTFGKDITVVTEQGEAQLIKENDFRNKFTQEEQPDQEASTQQETVVELAPAPVSAALEEFSDDLANLVGKRVTTNVYDLAGNMLLDEGDIVTEEVIEKVKEMGRSKALELALKTEE